MYDLRIAQYLKMARGGFFLFCLAPFVGVHAQSAIGADPASLAFEQGRWEDAIAEYREILAGYPEDRLSQLRIAQAQRELGRYEEQS